MLLHAITCITCHYMLSKMLMYAIKMQERKEMREKIIETKIYLDVKLETKRWRVGNYELQSIYRQHATNLALFFRAE